MGMADFMETVEAQKAQKRRFAELGVAEKQPGVAWMLWLILGWAGGHRFYLRKQGWLMLAWFFAGSIVLASILPGDTGLNIWGIGVLAWLVVDAFFIPGWVRDFQRAYAKAERKLEAEDMIEMLTLPLTRAAQKHGGTLTVAQGVLETGLTFTQIEQCLMEMSKTGYVGIENADDGNLQFVFGDLPEYDEDEARQQAELEAQAFALQEASEMLNEQAEQLERAERRSETRSAAKTGIAAGIAMFGARALLGEVFDDDE